MHSTALFLFFCRDVVVVENDETQFPYLKSRIESLVEDDVWARAKDEHYNIWYEQVLENRPNSMASKYSDKLKKEVRDEVKTELLQQLQAEGRLRAKGDDGVDFNRVDPFPASDFAGSGSGGFASGGSQRVEEEEEMAELQKLAEKGELPA